MKAYKIYLTSSAEAARVLAQGLLYEKQITGNLRGIRWGHTGKDNYFLPVGAEGSFYAMAEVLGEDKRTKIIIC